MTVQANSAADVKVGAVAVLTRAGLQNLIDALAARSYRVVGPLVRDGAIVHDEISRVEQLPEGWTDSQDGGRYRLERREDKALFGHAAGPQSWKHLLHLPRETLWRARRTAEGFEVLAAEDDPPRHAFLGVRACDLKAIAVQDRVFLDGPHEDKSYGARRRGAFIVAVNCGSAGGTCFCVSMEAGPKAESGFDLALTELIDGAEPGNSPDYLVEVGSAAGGAVLAEVPRQPAGESHVAAARAVVARTAGEMGRRLETRGLKERLQANPNHPRWDAVAARCLSCGNCTMVCPTCFCTSVEDHTDLGGAVAERVKRWDSCFTLDFSYIHGGSVRDETRSRYRQWMTHKLASWYDQFDTSGCVGCGRCITWCPVGIDITEEAAAVGREEPGGGEGQDGRS